VSLRPALAAEFFGTAFLLLAVVGSGIASDSAGSEAAQLFQHSVIIGLALIGLVSAFGPTSGAHFNPAVTVADAALGNRSWSSVGPYVAAQVAGALVGTAVTNVLFGLDAFALSDKLRSGPALVSSELIATLILVTVIFATVRGEHVRSIPLVVGTTVGALIFATPSTALMNPAVTFARIFTDTWTGVRIIDAIPYIMVQFGGALLAVVIVRLTQPAREVATSDA
jgi:glycerol uptake facilitator-like aquaporin